MPIGTPTGIGTATGGGPATLTTSGAAPASSLIIGVFSSGASTARSLSSVSGGGLTWTVDHALTYTNFFGWGIGVASAQAPSGLASSTVITPTWSGSTTGFLSAAAYCTGLDASAPADVHNGQGQTIANGTWTTLNSTTTFADTVVIGGCITDGAQTNTPDQTELYDFQYATEPWTMCVQYNILASTQSTNLSGTWSLSNNDRLSAFVAYKSATPAAPQNQLAWVRA